MRRRFVLTLYSVMHLVGERFFPEEFACTRSIPVHTRLRRPHSHVATDEMLWILLLFSDVPRVCGQERRAETCCISRFFIFANLCVRFLWTQLQHVDLAECSETCCCIGSTLLLNTDCRRILKSLSCGDL